jgi:phospholipid-binding lipoprotein MlaA
MQKIFLLSLSINALLASSVMDTSVQKPGPENLATEPVSDKNAWLFEGLDENNPEIKSVDSVDPLEPMNRAFYSFNRTFVDGLVLKPLACLYRDTVHDKAKEGTENFIANMSLPLQTINHTLQMDGTRAFHSVFRLVINTTVGLFGLMDPASRLGFPNYETSFNETLTTWGLESGPYLMLPFVGPSSFRGVWGTGGDWFLNPWRFYTNNKKRFSNRHGQERYLFLSLYGANIVAVRSKLIGMVNDIDQTSKDPYVSIRNYYFQQQKKMEDKIKERRKKEEIERS